MIDDYNREGLNITLDTSLNAKRVVKELDQLIAWRGTPRRIRVDNGPEYISETMRLWAIEREIELKFESPGVPIKMDMLSDSTSPIEKRCSMLLHSGNWARLLH